MSNLLDVRGVSKSFGGVVANQNVTIAVAVAEEGYLSAIRRPRGKLSSPG